MNIFLDQPLIFIFIFTLYSRLKLMNSLRLSPLLTWKQPWGEVQQNVTEHDWLWQNFTVTFDHVMLSFVGSCCLSGGIVLCQKLLHSVVFCCILLCFIMFCCILPHMLYTCFSSHSFCICSLHVSRILDLAIILAHLKLPLQTRTWIFPYLHSCICL
jgi:hypothetical protein